MIKSGMEWNGIKPIKAHADVICSVSSILSNSTIALCRSSCA